jgi:outer membrane protein OmpA-like peptidoglycan-associated protein/tetratricopeptide (TPR) repeat protein
MTGVLTVLFICACTMPVFSQKNGPLQLADQYFAAGDYYTAANLYKQYLNPPKKQTSGNDFPLNVKRRRVGGGNKNISRNDILFKQAESYRLANYWVEAAATYKEYIDKDDARRTEALYWYAVCQRSVGNYTAAEESLNKVIVSAGANSPYRANAQAELQTLKYIHKELARPDSILVSLRKLNIPNSNEKGAFAVTQVNGSQFLVSSTEPDSAQTKGVNPYHSHLFYATLNNGSLNDMTPVDFSDQSIKDNQGAGSISKDGKYIYFSQWKKINGKTASAIYYSVKESKGWSEPILLPLVNVNGYSSKQPFCSADGKYIFFASDRPGGSGKFDIWYAGLKADGTTEKPVNLGADVNTSGDEQSPFYHNSSSTLVFSSNGLQGLGGYDLFSAKGSEVTWTAPQNLGYPVNSSRDDLYFFADEKNALLTDAIFSSDRGTGCCLETYTISKAPKKKMLRGIVRDGKDNNPLANVIVTLKDPAGNIKSDTTDADGSYDFEGIKDNYHDLTLLLTRDTYRDTVSILKIKNTDESDLLIDKLINTDLSISKIEKKLVIKAENVVSVYFDFDRSILKPAAISKLDSIYAVLTGVTSATIQISGYTDGLGSEEYNKKLSDRRAKACADYLIKKGIDSSRVSFESFGACCPVEMEKINGRDNPDGRSLNRRALINVKKEE